MQAAYQGAPLGSSYRLVEPVGEGAVGTVWTATRSDTSALFAAKLLNLSTRTAPNSWSVLSGNAPCSCSFSIRVSCR